MFELFVDHYGGTEESNMSELFRKLDLDGDGTLDYNEFLQAAINHQKMLNQDNIREIFTMFDLDGDGFISFDELEYMFKNNLNYNASDKFLQEIMEEVDQNNDNQISFEEF